MSEPRIKGGMPVKHCRACTVRSIPANSRDYPYMAGLNDVLAFGFDDVAGNLCDEHKTMLSKGQDVIDDLMARYLERKKTAS